MTKIEQAVSHCIKAITDGSENNEKDFMDRATELGIDIETELSRLLLKNLEDREVKSIENNYIRSMVIIHRNIEITISGASSKLKELEDLANKDLVFLIGGILSMTVNHIKESLESMHGL